jgi:hypothetical protein
MILGMSIGTFTILHVIITLIAIGSGLIVVGGMFACHRLPVTTALFLFTTALTSVTGFLFPIHGFTPALDVGILACLILVVALFALYKERLVGAWRWIYAITAVASLYLNVFVLVVHSFAKVSALNALAPTQTEPPFAITQAAVLAIFIVITIVAVVKFRPPNAVRTLQYVASAFGHFSRHTGTFRSVDSLSSTEATASRQCQQDEAGRAARGVRGGRMRQN